uniref:Uncharacterized protein n=1 Tax=Cacopsylla melanoneura TaxID=428564 RepID=A0A8D9E2Q6_9HEMI
MVSFPTQGSSFFVSLFQESRFWARVPSKFFSFRSCFTLSMYLILGLPLFLFPLTSTYSHSLSNILMDFFFPRGQTIGVFFPVPSLRSLSLSLYHVFSYF